jgi:uncharacterized protein
VLWHGVGRDRALPGTRDTGRTDERTGERVRCGVVNDVVSDPAVLSDDVAVLPVAEVAQMLRVPVSRVHQMVRDGQLLSVRRAGAVCVPSDFFSGGAPVKGLSGTIILLRDGGYDDPDILRWLFADDSSLPGSPIAVLRAGRHREVKRRAQAMAF